IEDMPFLEDGTQVDIVLNPLGVPSRMNVGQIFETHLGWAARGLGKQIQEMLDEIHERGKELTGKDTKTVRAKLKEIYGDQYAKEIDARDDEQLMELASNLTAGIPMGTPVFDGAREPDVTAMLEKAGLDPSGQVTLFDGRSGEPFDRKVTVGYIYMLKLHHLVADKIHACSSRRCARSASTSSWKASRKSPRRRPPSPPNNHRTPPTPPVRGRGQELKE